jgi:hypothetical protein
MGDLLGSPSVAPFPLFFTAPEWIEFFLALPYGPMMSVEEGEGA